MTSMYLAVSSCICCRYSKVRTHEGSGLTIRIPRQLSDRGPAHAGPASAHPLVSPDTHARSTNRHTPVTKSKSLTTSMDKLTSSQKQQKQKHKSGEQDQQGSGGSSSRESSRPCSRGSTPSSSRSSAPSRPPSRRSHPPAAPSRSSRSPDPHTPEPDDHCGKSNSPCGSEVSLHSAKSATSAKSNTSVASAKSSTSVKSNGSTRSNLSVRSSASDKSDSSARSAKSKEPKKSPGKSGSPSSLGSSRQSLKSVGRATKAKSPAPTHSGSNTLVVTPTHTANRRRSTGSNASASSTDTAHQNGMANGEQQNSSSSSRRTTPPRQTPTRTSGSGTPSGTGTPRHMQPKKSLPVFNSYMSLFQVQEKLRKGEIIEGVLRINPKNYEDAYISAPDGGTDIYIGGVRDRNAALHGDVVVVQIKPLDQWKVLYEQLDEYLEEHKDKKIIVYKPLESIITASLANTASSYNPIYHKNSNYIAEPRITEDLNKSKNVKETLERESHLEQGDSDVVVEGDDVEEDELNSSRPKKEKKRRKRRGRKKGKTEKCDATLGAEPCDSNRSSTEAPLQNFIKKRNEDELQMVVVLQDELVVEAANKYSALPTSGGHEKIPGKDSDEEVKGFVVPPDQLSECEFTDDESGCSEILDYEQAREDQSFMQAQWEAYQREQKEKRQEDFEQYAGSKKKEIMYAVEASGVEIQEIKDAENLRRSENAITEEEFMKGKFPLGSQSSAVTSEQNLGRQVLSANDVNSVIKTEQVKSENDQPVVHADASYGARSKLTGKIKHNTSEEKLDTDTHDQLMTDVDNKFQNIRVNTEQEVREQVPDISTNTNPETPISNSQKDGKARRKVPSVSERLQFSVNKVCRKEEPIYVSPDKSMPAKYQTDASNASFSTPKQNRDDQRFHKKPYPSRNSYQQRENKNNSEDRYKGNSHFREESESKNTPIQVNRMRRGSERADRSEPNIFQIQRLDNWNKFVQRTAIVVAITERKHTRLGAGTLKLFADKNPKFALFSPSDCRVPRMKIPMYQCPQDFFTRSQDYQTRIFLARITQWSEPKFALGELVRDVGAAGDIEAETEALLLEHGIDYEEFPDSVLKGLPSLPWSIPASEIANRTDLRDLCIFTIDPSTARDLDDAVSCEPLPSGNFRVGVHIADVSFFIPEGTPLDNLAANRATSVYLTQMVIPMLPRVLCEHLCSLNPGEDRLAFSVIWELQPDGKVIGEWFGRTVIRSCVKLAYEHAQSMIEDPGKEWSANELPEITGRYSSREISQVVNNLHSIAIKLRKKRFEQGALRLDQVKIAFNLDWETKMPNGFYVYEIKDSNRLIEEFMLLANMAVAHKIYRSFPEVAVLRRHPPPLDKPMNNTVNQLGALGIHLDASSAGSLNNTLEKYIGRDKYSSARLQVITSLCSKPMQFARYFCCGIIGTESLFRHYALNVPMYTHFTSPIRRYVDVMVHRVLAAAIDPGRYNPTGKDKTMIQQIADHCNDKKQTSKVVQEVSTELYLGLFIKQVKEMVEEAMVIMILDRAFDVLVLQLGVIKRVYTDKLLLDSYQHKKEGGKSSLTLNWKGVEHRPPVVQEINMFSLVTVSLKPMESSLKFNAFLLRPS